jgi:hypothetical protein
MNYKNIYDSLIERGQTREPLNQYVEKHHIKPKCMGGSNNPENLVELTPEEHYVAHQLLIKIYPNNYKLIMAAIMMCHGIEEGIGKKDRSNNKLYGWLRKKQYVRVPQTCKCCSKIKMVMPCKVRIYCNVRCYANDQKIEHVCKGCGVVFYKAKSYSSVYCNQDCYRKFVKPIKKICLYCGENFHKKGNIKYCSVKCSNSGKTKDRISRNCLNCNGVIIILQESKIQRKFCNKKCKLEFISNNSKMVTLSCLLCSKPFKSNQPEKRKYCSIDCLKKSRLVERRCNICDNIFKIYKSSHKKSCCDVENPQ